MKTHLLSLVLLMATAFSVVAQQEYTWDYYGIGFTLADDFIETTNTEEEFSADGDGMSFSIIPFKDASVSDNDISVYTISIAASLNLEVIDDVNIIALKNFKGGYVEGMLDGTRVFLMGLIDPSSETNFFVIITFADDDEVAVDEAIRMVQSFRKM